MPIQVRVLHPGDDVIRVAAHPAEVGVHTAHPVVNDLLDTVAHIAQDAADAEGLGAARAGIHDAVDTTASVLQTGARILTGKENQTIKDVASYINSKVDEFTTARGAEQEGKDIVQALPVNVKNRVRATDADVEVDPTPSKRQKTSHQSEITKYYRASRNAVRKKNNQQARLVKGPRGRYRKEVVNRVGNTFIQQK